MTHARRLSLFAACAALSLAACHPKSVAQAKDDLVKGGVHVSAADVIDRPVTVADTLACPDRQGGLTLKSKAADGLSCTYTSDKGEVELRRLETPAGDEAALAPIKAGLDALLPAQARGGTINVVSEKRPDGRETTKVDMPFLHVSEDAGKSHVKILGMTIDADKDKGDKDAKPLSSVPHGRERVYVLAGDGKATGGYNAVGYVARGAETGPLVVGVFRYAKAGDWSHGDRHNDHDLDALIDLNATKGAGQGDRTSARSNAEN